MPTLLSPVALLFVIKTTYQANIDNKIDIMTTLNFQCCLEPPASRLHLCSPTQNHGNGFEGHMP